MVLASSQQLAGAPAGTCSTPDIHSKTSFRLCCPKPACVYVQKHFAWSFSYSFAMHRLILLVVFVVLSMFQAHAMARFAPLFAPLFAPSPAKERL